jgi:hypothetical protein
MATAAAPPAMAMACGLWAFGGWAEFDPMTLGEFLKGLRRG